ncbi:MAG: hypothetical protein IPK68_03170 [Bdellovibrionales bacterium]|nr:hypothetical protein [Bdellovibrionales bacterium]
MMGNRGQGVFLSFRQNSVSQKVNQVKSILGKWLVISLFGAQVLLPQSGFGSDEPTTPSEVSQPSVETPKKGTGACRKKVASAATGEPKLDKSSTDKPANTGATRAARAEKPPAVGVDPSNEAAQILFELLDFLRLGSQVDLAENPAVKFPFLVMNSAERAAALIYSTPPQRSRDPLFKRRPVEIFPTLSGVLPESENRGVVGQEGPIAAVVQFIVAKANGQNVGKSPGLPGPAGTGKTEFLVALDELQKNLPKKRPIFREYTYVWKDLDKIPSLAQLRVPALVSPQIPRSPFTLLRSDFQNEIFGEVLPQIRGRHKFIVSNGWTELEPHSVFYLTALFHHYFPKYRLGTGSIDDLSREEYLWFLGKLNEHVVIVPRSSVVAESKEPLMIRAQPLEANLTRIFAAPNMRNAANLGANHPLATDYTGSFFRADGRPVGVDELYRNGPDMLNALLEVVQNGIVQTDYGQAVLTDSLVIWTSNNESIAKASEDQALKASLDRAEKNHMNLLISPDQIEQIAVTRQIGAHMFEMRALESNERVPYSALDIYPLPDAEGKTATAYRRYALYYKGGVNRGTLVSPLTLNYMSWLASATRMVVDVPSLRKHQSELSLVTANPSQFLDPIYRLKVILGEIDPSSDAELVELSRMHLLLNEGDQGISSRDLETWLRYVVQVSQEKNIAITPLLADIAFQELLDSSKIKPEKFETRAHWQSLRRRIKFEMLLPRLANDVRIIISGEGEKSDRIYDEISRELIELANYPEADYVSSDSGAQKIAINKDRLQRIFAIYQQKNNLRFEPKFLLRTIKGAGKASVRDAKLMEAVRQFLADEDSRTADYISAFDTYYRGETNDPTIVEQVGRSERMLSKYGYDVAAFQQAVGFVAQMRAEKLIKRDSEAP